MTVEQLEKTAWLNRAYYADIKLNSLISQRYKLRELAQRVSICYEGNGKGKSAARKNGAEDALIRLADIERAIDNEVKNLLDVYTEIDKAIKAVDDPVLQTILKRRYLAFETMEQIAEGINYSVRNTKYKHKQALNKVCTPLHCIAP